MGVPTYDRFMLPLLQLVGDGNEHTLREAIDQVIVLFGLTEDDRKEMLPSQTEPVLQNRVRWARTYLRKAGLLETTAKRTFRITERGRKVLQERPAAIDAKYLLRFPEFAAFRGVTTPGPKPPDNSQTDENPEEALAASYQRLRRVLAQDLLDRLKQSSSEFFEQLVIDVLVAMGYGGSRQDAGKAVGQSGDEGIDGIIKEDKLGLDAVYIQAKRWTNPVGRPVLQAFAGSLMGQRASKGVLITTSQFTDEARDYVGRIEKRIVLVDGVQLAEFMMDHGVGVTEVASYRVQRVDEDYFASD
jgi:restriction system protein